ncbi:MAG: hypothetical protein IPK26_19240 [Planctomycetes bacterium]|nr:hypothetical protein [Planctomycetota bacterium]
MSQRAVTVLVAACLAGAFCSQLGSPRGQVLEADPPEAFRDSDFDFLPDDIEWAVLTDALRPDTDGDGVGDFVEVVQRGSPRAVGAPRPADHEMRIIVTSSSSPLLGDETWLHLLFRFVDQPSSMTSFRSWIEFGLAPGLQIPLDSLASGGVVFRSRSVPTEGELVSVSVPLVSSATLNLLLPCTIVAEAGFGTRTVRHGVKLFDLNGTTATLVPWDDRFAVQTLAPSPSEPGSDPNKVCVLSLRPVSVTPGGIAFEVDDADCVDCNDLECGQACADTEGWVFIVPGGLGTITGGG